MRSSGVVPLDPLPDCRFRLNEIFETMLPDTLLFQAAKESLNDPVLFGRIGSDELLCQSIIPAGRSEPPALEDQPVVTSYHRGPACGSEGSEAGKAGLLDGSFGLLPAGAVCVNMPQGGRREREEGMSALRK